MNIFRRPIQNLIFVGLSLSFGSLFFSNFAAAATCGQNCFGRIVNNISPETRVTATKRFPFGMSGDGQHLRFAFESEYSVDEAVRLFDAYAPHESLGVTHSAWGQMPDEARIAWVKQNQSRLFPNERDPTGSKLVKVENTEEFSFLPDSLILDSTGNIEIVLKPFETLEEWQVAVTAINRRFGEGSMQATIGTKKEAFLGRVPGSDAPTVFSENIGYLKFMNDLDTLEKLQAGYQRSLQDANAAVVRSFNHPWLGPMTTTRHAKLKSAMQRMTNGEDIAQYEIQQIVGYAGSFKYFGGTAFRPDIDPSSIVLEIRDCHKNLACLQERLMRAVHFQMSGKSQFRKTTTLDVFDPAADYEKLSAKSRTMLERVFPSKQPEGDYYTPDNAQAMQVYRNFAFPARDWQGHIATFGQPDLANTIAAAKAEYFTSLDEIADALTAGRLTNAQASVKVQTALAKFSNDAKIHDAMDSWLNRNLLADSKFRRTLSATLSQSAPLSQAFPKTVWEGPLSDRVSKFAKLWPNNVKMVDDVRFTFSGQPSSTRRKVLVVSIPEDGTAQQRLLLDYTNALSRSTVSFPMGDSQGHLYSRIGNKTYDFYSGVSEKPYRLPGDKFEPFVELSPLEELRLRSYVRNAHRSSPEVIGSFGMSGVVDGKTTLLRRNNKPKSGAKHNCTSWMCTAPVGDNRRPLFELTGAYSGLEVYTNPGWWGSFLTGRANADRVPFVAYFTYDTIETALQTIRPGAVLDKSFGAY